MELNFVLVYCFKKGDCYGNFNGVGGGELGFFFGIGELVVIYINEIGVGINGWSFGSV